jgi:O-antigen ligase
MKRLDSSRGSVQHRVVAWKAGFEIMRDNPFGVGWGKTVSTYQEHYSPPENGATAITTNDYLMLGTQIGIPALLCFFAYIAMQLGMGQRIWKKTEIAEETARGDARPTTLDIGRWTSDAQLRIACRSAAIVMLVAFWFDGGLFKLATASVFWILLELGAERKTLKIETLKAENENAEPYQEAEGGKAETGLAAKMHKDFEMPEAGMAVPSRKRRNGLITKIRAI